MYNYFKTLSFEFIGPNDLFEKYRIGEYYDFIISEISANLKDTPFFYKDDYIDMVLLLKSDNSIASLCFTGKYNTGTSVFFGEGDKQCRYIFDLDYKIYKRDRKISEIFS